MFFLFSSCMIAASLPGPAPATKELITRALTEPTQITLENIRLVDAISRITEQTGVRIVMAPEAMRYVPHGPETVIEKVNIANVPLREGLDRLFRPLGMKFEPADDHVRIVPKDALLCLGRAPTWTELETLSQLSAAQPGIKSSDLERLQDRIQFQVSAPDAWGSISQAIQNVGAGFGDDVLTVAANQLGWTWCLSEDHVVVSTFEQLLRRRIKQPISVRMNNRPLIDVMQAVGAALNAAVRVEPGAIASLPMQMQKNYSINATNLPAEQVLENISANTGLGYLSGPEGIFFFDPRGAAPGLATTMSNQPSTPPTGSSDPYVGKIVIELGEGKTFEWLIRKSELPDDLKQVRERDIQQFIDEFRQRRLTESRP